LVPIKITTFTHHISYTGERKGVYGVIVIKAQREVPLNEKRALRKWKSKNKIVVVLKVEIMLYF
jgi:hypothetical protein